MQVEPIPLLNRNKIASDYLHGKLGEFFHYSPFEYTEQRLQDLSERTFARTELVKLLLEMNGDWGAPKRTMIEIKRLLDEKSVVVIGGQQAGLLTGPLYSINKIISIIKYAREQEEKFGVPVIPVFWIAGEDHDFDEINHIFSINDRKVEKRTTKQVDFYRKSVGHIELDDTYTNKWLQEVFNDLIETEHTKSLVHMITTSLEKSTTFVDFFARLIFELFKEEGIVLIDSSNDRLRQYEAEWFEQLINNQSEITNTVYETAQKMQQAGYSLQVDVGRDDANLFYHDENGERILLKREGELWLGKNDEVSLTTEQLLTIAKEHPELLSNNVISRPFMQEAIFPTLAFLAGDGEISYWALLKDAFYSFDNKIKMPPIVPRLSFTFVTKRIQKLLEIRSLDAPTIVHNGCEKLRMNWLISQENPPIEMLFNEAENKFYEIHTSLRQLGFSINDHLGKEAEKNWQHILKQLNYLKRKTIKQLEEKYSNELDQFTDVNNALHPNNQLQERVLNIVPLLNECGFTFLQDVMNESYSFTQNHYIIYL